MQTHGTAMGPKNACSYADLAMGIIDQKAKSGETKPKLWWRYRDDIFDLWTQGTTKLNEFTDFINSLYPTIKFTMVSSEISLNVLDLTLLLVDGFIQTDIYSKPTDHHIYLLHNSAHPSHCTKVIPFGVVTRVRRNCSTIEKFEEFVVKNIRTILLIGVTNLLKLNKNLKRPKIHPGKTSLHLNGEREKLFSPWWSILTLICGQTSAKLLSHIAIFFMIHLL